MSPASHFGLRCLVASLVLAVGASGAVLPQDSTGRARLALIPVKRWVTQTVAAEAVEAALARQLSELGEVIPAAATREALRRLRLRDLDAASADTLRRLGAELQADWLVAAALHEAAGYPVPDLAISLRLYDARDGGLVWVGFEGRSGLDGRTILGLGVVESLDELAPELVARLLAESPFGAGRGDGKRSLGRREGRDLGTLALVPFTAYVEEDALAAAATATEATRAILGRAQARLAAPTCVHEVLRRQRLRAWGELPQETRSSLVARCGANRVLTGAVEQWSTGGSGLEPEPKITIAMRLLDADSGRILWMGSREEGGWDNAGLFRLGRLYSRGEVLERLLTRLIGDLLSEAEAHDSRIQ